ncbi:hypothetical protein ACJRO7_004005, partial [Eucalyptus globulus]
PSPSTSASSTGRLLRLVRTRPQAARSGGLTARSGIPTAKSGLHPPFDQPDSPPAPSFWDAPTSSSPLAPPPPPPPSTPSSSAADPSPLTS